MKKRVKENKILTPDEAEELFSKLDETGHVNSELAEEEKENRKTKGTGFIIDPLSDTDPSGSNVGKLIRKTAVGFVLVVLAIVMISQVSCGLVRRVSTASLTDTVSIQSVSAAMKAGIEWGGGFTQFPQNFSVQEADEHTGRVEVTVVDTSSSTEKDCMATSYVQATAFATNALLNQNINQVIYHVGVHEAEEGKIQTSVFFGFLQPTGPVKSFMTFVFTKASTAAGGFNIFCSITGIDSNTMERLKESLGANPLDIFSSNSNEKTDSDDSKLD